MEFDDTINSLSANTLFHFTNSFENLISIIKNDIRPHYCLEDFRQFGDPNTFDLEIAIPMVCFCDIPLSNTKRHVDTYGYYGIGLTKDWGKSKGISPVIYTYPNSPLAGSIGLITLYATDHVKNITLVSDKKQSILEGSDIIASYLKPYDGKLWRNDKYRDKTIRFYDEREWRYVPSTRKLNLPRSLNKSHFLDSEFNSKVNKQIGDNCGLSFTPNDIKYIIIKREEEIIPIVQAITNVNGKYSHDEVQILSTRIITVPQILEDF